MRITIVYDNEIAKDIKGLKPGWGFSCFIQTKEKNILFPKNCFEGGVGYQLSI